MERTSQLIVRNTAQLANADLLLINPPQDDLFRELTPNHSAISVWSQDFGDYRWFIDQGATADFGCLPDAENLASQVILFLPREKDRLELLLHFLAASLPPEGTLWLVGENHAGIRSATRPLRKFFGHTAKIDTARHCALFQAKQASAAAPFSLSDYQQKWMLATAAGDLRVASLPGVFAHGRLDRGTELLLQVLAQQTGQQSPRGCVLDFACGTGVIGLSLLLADSTMDLTLLDNSALALESAKLSLQANDLHATILPSDGLAEVRQRYDWIVSNPPFHRGVATHYDIARRFFVQAGRTLSRQGKMLLVLNRHLPYEAWLSESFASVEALETSNEYKVLRVSRPKT